MILGSLEHPEVLSLDDVYMLTPGIFSAGHSDPLGDMHWQVQPPQAVQVDM